MKDSATKAKKLQQIAHMQPFNQLLSELYGQDVTVQIQPSPSLHVKEQGVTEREATLLRWVFEYIQKQPQITMNAATPSLPDVLQMLWKMAKEKSLGVNGLPTLPEFGQMPSAQDVISRLPLPLVLIYLDVSGKNTHQHNIAQTDWFEIIQELASGYNKRCILTPISDAQVGLLIPPKLAEQPEQDLDETMEECTSWVDALLAEVFVDAKVGISRPVTSLAQLTQGMMEAIHACSIGCLNGSKHGVFAYDRLGMQRILYDLNEEERNQYRRSILSNDGYQALGQELRETALAFFRNQLNISETARMLYMHRNSLLYRLDKIRELTGYDIRKFEDAVTFWTALMLWKIDEVVG